MSVIKIGQTAALTGELVETMRFELTSVRKTPTGAHIKTGDVRRISASLFTRVKSLPPYQIFEICEGLLEQRDWALGVAAYDFAYRIRKQYDENAFNIFENWLVNYVRGWGDCDDFCTHAFGALIYQNIELAEKTVEWTKRDEFWMRRAAAVILIPSIKRGMYRQVNPLRISDILMNDEHDLVRKGYGWMLKELSEEEPELVYEYLKSNYATMPRVAFRYALEKLAPEQKKRLMSL